MAELRATPMVNPVMGLLADRLKKVQQFGAKPFGYENPPVEMMMNLLGVPAVQQTMERMAYGEPLTTGRGMTTKPHAESIEAAMAVAPVAGLLGKATKGLPVGASIKNVGKFDVVKRDASDIFGEGAQRIRYTDPKSSGSIEVLAKPDGSASVLSLEVPEKFRGKKIGESLQKQVLEDFPDMQGQVSSKAAATTAYRIGRRPVDMPDATLKDVHKMIDEDSSVNMISPQMQQRISPSASYPQQEALDIAQRNAALPIEEGLLAIQREQPMQGLLQSKVPSPSSLTMPDVPTIEQMQKYGRVEAVPLSQAVSFQSARNWDKFNKGEHVGDLVQGFGDKPLALRLENGEYIIYDGNHRTDLAMQAGKTELPMNVIDVKSYDPSNAGRRPVPPSMTDDELLRSLLE